MGNVNAPSLGTNGPVTSLTNNPARVVVVETVGYYLYGVYVFASMIVLLNLLIAVMSNTFNEVQVGILISNRILLSKTPGRCSSILSSCLTC